MSVSFFTSVHYQDDGSWSTAIHNWIEDYVSFREDIVVIQPDGLTGAVEKSQSSCLSTEFKIITCLTFIFPVIMAGVKLAVRWFSHPAILIDDKGKAVTEIVAKEMLLPEANKQIISRLNHWKGDGGKNLFSIPHPAYVEEDRVNFPEDRVNAHEIYRIKECISYFPEFEERRQFFFKGNRGRFVPPPGEANMHEMGRNAFFHWLNSDDFYSINFEANQSRFMNCVDFAYQVLHEKGLVSKKDIKEKYRTQMQNQLSNQNSNSFYGFDLNRFTDFDPIQGSSGQRPKPGDLLIGFKGDKPEHILFLSGRDPAKGEWKGVGLWNVPGGRPRPRENSLVELQENLNRYSEQGMHFKYCCLENAL